MNKSDDSQTVIMIGLGFLILGLYNFFRSLVFVDQVLLLVAVLALIVVASTLIYHYCSKSGRERQKKITFAKEIPAFLLMPESQSIQLGFESDLETKIYLPDVLRSKHVHILGATGSGKTESVILNFLGQDIKRGLGSIILDAKGDHSFLDSLRGWLPQEKLKVFDLSSENSLSYNPLEIGSPIESAQRLFSSLTWSEPYYKSKAFSALQRIFQLHHQRYDKNPNLREIDVYLGTPASYAAFVESIDYPKKHAMEEFAELSGLRDQIKILSLGFLQKILSPSIADIQLSTVNEGNIFYFRLQSLLSPQLATIVGKFLIQHLNFLAGTAHRTERNAKRAKLVPIYLDEFATFACPEFADLISKARSAGFALHFSHQSIGDLAEVSKGFLNQITDNSATKILLRVNCPDTAEYFARAFGTKLYQKVTQRVTNVKELDRAEVNGEGSQREAHQFRAAPDLFKTLPTGTGSVLIAHGADTPHGASTVFKIKFPKLNLKEALP